ncbi:hypothetical protein Tco_0212819 [Tanacetum coccineum]
MTSLNSRNKNVDASPRKPKRVKDYTYHKEKMLMCKQAKKVVPLQAEQADWIEDTDEEIDEQELEAHYSYMAKIQEVPTADSGTDTKPLEQVDCNVILDSPNMCDNDLQTDQHVEQCDDERVALANLIENLTLDTKENKKILKQLKKANTSLTQELKECKSNLEESNTTRDSCLIALQSKQAELEMYMTLSDCTVDYDKLELKLNETLGLLAQKEIDIKEGLKLKAYEISVVKDKHDEKEKDLDKLIAMEKQLKFLNEIIPYDRSDPANRFVPDREETLTLEKDIRSKLNKDLLKPYDYTKQTSLYENFKPAELVDQAWEKHSHDHFRAPTAYDMEILIKTCLMPLALKTQNGSFKFIYEIKQEMHADLKYIKSLEKEIVKLESDKADFLNMYDLLLQEFKECDCLAQKLSKQTETVSKEVYNELSQSFTKLKKHSISLEVALQQCQEQMKNDTVCKEKASTVFLKEREQYFEIQNLKAQLNTDPRVSTSTGVNHRTNVSIPPLRSTQMKDKVMLNNSQVKVKKTEIVQLIIFIVDSGCTKHMMGNLKLLCNFVEKYLGTVHFGNDQFAPIIGYGDLVRGNITINRFYYVEGLNHNLFSVGQFCDANLDVAFRKSTCFVSDLQGNDLLTVSKAKRSSFKTKVVPSSKGRLNLLHMDLCGPMRVASINGKKYILAEAIATACYTQNRSIIIPTHEKTSYHNINDMKPLIRHLHIFGCICYLTRDGENLDKMKEKGNPCILVFAELQGPTSVRERRCTVHFGNDQFAIILGYGDLVQGNITIKRVYYVEGLNNNLFSVGQFCDADLEVAFRKSTCFVRDLQGNNFTHGNSKAKRSSFKTKVVPSSKGWLNLLHMDLFGPMRVASINGKKYILMKEKGDPCILVGYSTQSKGYRFYNKRTRLIVESIHIRFDEIKEMSETSIANNTSGPYSPMTKGVRL